MNLLDVLLTLMNEEELRWNDDTLFGDGFSGGLVIISFDGEIPECDGIVSRGGGEGG